MFLAKTDTECECVLVAKTRSPLGASYIIIAPMHWIAPSEKDTDNAALVSTLYEYFLGEFAMSEGQGGGEFYTPSSIVRLLTEVIEPYHGRILDPACGSGGMFVSSARFVSEHKKNPAAELSIHGVE